MKSGSNSPPNSPNLSTPCSSSSSIHLHSVSLVSSQSSKPEECQQIEESRSTNTQQLNQPLLETLNDCIFNETSSNLTYCNFPVVLKVPFQDSNKEEISKIFASFKDLTINTEGDEYHVGFVHSRVEFDDLISKLYLLNIAFELDYGKFISHPGILFIKNLSSNLMFESEEAESITITKDKDTHKLFEFLMDNCKFKSLNEVKLFNQDNAVNSAFAIVKFSNYLDVDLLIDKFNKQIPNPFNQNETIPLFLNRYLNRKERFNPRVPVASPINSLNQDNFNLIIIENFLNFIPEAFSTVEFCKLIEKFGEFGNAVESIYFPILDYYSRAKETTKLNCFDYGYIKFKSNANLMENTLKVLYYLNDLSWDEFVNFDSQHLPSLNDPIDPIKSRNNKIQITIAQHKHNHYLYANAQNFYLSIGQKNQFSINFPNPMYTINLYCRSLNYQETNIYVNNLSMLFNNDDLTWEAFWKQFGTIKSAKIIKPQFYESTPLSSASFSSSSESASISSDSSTKNNKAGKIGFIFYESFKMAIRAILMTNNKVVNLDKFNPILIQSSFAIQKSKFGSKNGDNNMVTAPLPLPTNNVPNGNNLNNSINMAPIPANANATFKKNLQLKQKQFYAAAAASIVGRPGIIAGSLPMVGATNGSIPYEGPTGYGRPQVPQQHHHHPAPPPQPILPPYPYYGYPNPYIICPPY